VQGSLTFSAHYQQAPLPLEGNIVKREWIRSYKTAPKTFDFKVASWDTASTLNESSDYSVGTVWGARGLDFYLLDVVRGRWEVPDLRRRIIQLSERWEVDQTIIEDSDIGRAVMQDLRRSGELSTFPWRPKFDKKARFQAQSSRFESGQVHCPEETPWLASWMDELLGFPARRHDDQVDSTSQALDYLSSRTRFEHPKMQPVRPQKVVRPPARRAQ
jgi:predicted phage terminase large subunit-like protein